MLLSCRLQAKDGMLARRRTEAMSMWVWTKHSSLGFHPCHAVMVLIL